MIKKAHTYMLINFETRPKILYNNDYHLIHQGLGKLICEKI